MIPIQNSQARSLPLIINRDKCSLLFLITLAFFVVSHGKSIGQTHNSTSSTDKTLRNYIGGYIGLIELNVNYERNLVQLSLMKGEKAKTYSHDNYNRTRFLLNARLGYGYFTNLQGEYQYPNAVFVFCVGRKFALLEADLGIKYMTAIGTPAEGFPVEELVPDLFVGYRYDKPGGRFYFRAGHGYPGLFVFGLGFKF